MVDTKLRSDQRRNARAANSSTAIAILTGEIEHRLLRRRPHRPASAALLLRTPAGGAAARIGFLRALAFASGMASPSTMTWRRRRHRAPRASSAFACQHQRRGRCACNGADGGSDLYSLARGLRPNGLVDVGRWRRSSRTFREKPYRAVVGPGISPALILPAQRRLRLTPRSRGRVCH